MRSTKDANRLNFDMTERLFFRSIVLYAGQFKVRIAFKLCFIRIIEERSDNAGRILTVCMCDLDGYVRFGIPKTADRFVISTENKLTALSIPYIVE